MHSLYEKYQMTYYFAVLYCITNCSQEYCYSSHLTIEYETWHYSIFCRHSMYSIQFCQFGCNLTQKQFRLFRTNMKMDIANKNCSFQQEYLVSFKKAKISVWRTSNLVKLRKKKENNDFVLQNCSSNRFCLCLNHLFPNLFSHFIDS